jgi:hypothetical protein
MSSHAMGMAMTPHADESPAAKVMNEAIDLAIGGRSPYPDRAMFIDADTRHTAEEIREAGEQGYAAVICFPDGSTRVLSQEAAAASSR